MGTIETGRSLTALTSAVFFGLSYYLSVQLGVYFIADSVAFFWPASGVACGFFVFSPKKLWPLFSLAFIPAYIYPLLSHGGYSPEVMALLCAANLTQSVVAGYLVQRALPPPVDIKNLKPLLKFMLLAALVAPLIAASIGVPTFYFYFGYLSFVDYLAFWMIGNCAGILPVIVFMSVVVNVSRADLLVLTSRSAGERMLFCLSFIVFLFWVFARGEETSFANKISPYFIFPCVLYASIYYGAKFTGMIALLFAGLAAYFSASGAGPYISSDLPTVYNAISFDIFVIVLTSTGLLIAALQHELSAAKGQLKREKDEALELSRLKSHFIANVNHEIRTPVTGIVGAADLLSNSRLSPDQKRLVSVVRESCGYLLGLINSVLEFSRLENQKVGLEKTQINVETLVHSAVKNFIHIASEKGLSIYVDCRTDYVLVESDPTAIQQILGNLLTNAVKFTDQGHILITIDKAEGLVLSVADTGVGISEDKLDNIFECFSQEDTSLNRRFGGAGLGLAIVENLIQLIPGQIRVSSEAGVGSTFTVTLDLECHRAYPQWISTADLELDLYSNDVIASALIQKNLSRYGIDLILHAWDIQESKKWVAKPASIKLIHWEGLDSQHLARFCGSLEAGNYVFILPWFMDKPNHENIHFIYSPLSIRSLLEVIVGGTVTDSIGGGEHPPSTATIERTLKVLLTDDNQVNAMIVQRMLELKGCEVQLAENGKIAVEKAKLYQFDIIFMDIQMPVMDGFTATREIRRFDKAVIIVALTANSNDQLASEFQSAGMNDVLPKPINQEKLAEFLFQAQTQEPQLQSIS